ncbi:hypothetical protein BpHYR1_040686 [Brachionus plicatilis]|uniref:Uncharacterized protein n=1 Tax=Brachionus plicatilis TaxID=10195 RepID=A0A3M7P8N2_BRAPC|nr:hypothetical protein BpHYR1_040686 [Brachionus plicatilis]
MFQYNDLRNFDLLKYALFCETIFQFPVYAYYLYLYCEKRACCGEQLARHEHFDYRKDNDYQKMNETSFF